MIVRASGLGMGVGRFSRQLRGVGVLAMPDAALNAMRCIESVCGPSWCWCATTACTLHGGWIIFLTIAVDQTGWTSRVE